MNKTFPSLREVVSRAMLAPSIVASKLDEGEINDMACLENYTYRIVDGVWNRAVVKEILGEGEYENVHQSILYSDHKENAAIFGEWSVNRRISDDAMSGAVGRFGRWYSFGDHVVYESTRFEDSSPIPENITPSEAMKEVVMGEARNLSTIMLVLGEIFVSFECLFGMYNDTRAFIPTVALSSPQLMCQVDGDDVEVKRCYAGFRKKNTRQGYFETKWTTQYDDARVVFDDFLALDLSSDIEVATFFAKIETGR